jgi:hypothetical protein
MATLTVELPDRLATEIAAQSSAREQLNAFVVGAVEAWLRRRRGSTEESGSWDGAFKNDAADFVERLIENNWDLFEELARR